MNKKSNRQSIVDFNHISSELSDESREMLIRYYEYYHKQEYIYKKSYKFYNALYIGLNITSGILASASIVSLFTLPLVAIGSALALITSGVNEGMQFKVKSLKCEFAHKTYKDMLDDLRGYLRGISFNVTTLLEELRTKDKMIHSHVCEPLPFYVKKYDKKYKVSQEFRAREILKPIKECSE